MSTLILIDHYDSFSDNLRQLLTSQFKVVDMIAYDDPKLPGVLEQAVKIQAPVVFSPGPKSPDDVALSVRHMQALIGKVPVLGVCLGMQIMASLAGAKVRPRAQPQHGALENLKILNINEGCDFLNGIPGPVKVGVYNSLHAERLSGAAKNCGWHEQAINESGELQIIEYKKPGQYRAVGCQFHPESFLTQLGATMIRNFFTYYLAPLARATDPLPTPSKQMTLSSPLIV